MRAVVDAPARPRYVTARDPTLRTIGADTARTAIVLGQPLIPWQRQAADLLGALRPDGRFRYRRGVVIVPRRAGKSWLLLCHALTVCRLRAMARGFYAGHRRETAAAMWRDDWFPIVELSPLHPGFMTLRQSNGSEAMRFRHNRSTFRLMPPDGDAMRSFKADLANVDEGREFTLEQGTTIERAVFPTQATGKGGQFLLWSNAGTTESAWLAKWRDLGRASVDNPHSEIAYVEWSAPDGADIADRDVWRACHPGLGYHVLFDALEADYESLPPDDFAAEYLGLWPETRVDTALVAGWQSSTVADAAAAGAITFAVETSIDRTRTVIVVIGDGADARPVVELARDLDHGPHVVEVLRELVTAWRPVGLVFDAAGPVAALAHDLAELATNLHPLNTREVAGAAGLFHDRARVGGVVHRDDPTMVEAVAALRTRPAGGAFVFDRRQPGALPAIAAALAVWRWSDGRARPPTVA